MSLEAGKKLEKLGVIESKSKEKMLENLDYVKNCSSYGHNFTYCMIETIEIRGKYIVLWRDFFHFKLTYYCFLLKAFIVKNSKYCKYASENLHEET